MTDDVVREQVRAWYADAARAITAGAGSIAATAASDSCCGATATNASCCVGPIGAAATEKLAGSTVSGCGGGPSDPTFGSARYSADDRGSLPAEAATASLGCGNPTAVAELHAGETVLDLGSGGGIDVLLSARRVGPTGFVYGVDMTDEMLELARANAARAGVANVEFRRGTIEELPFPAASIDVVISNCVINLSTDKPAVLAEMFRVLGPGGRIGICDVVADDRLSPDDRAARGSHVGCIAGALSRTEYLAGLAAAGFVDAAVTFTHQVADGLHGATIRATRPTIVA